MIKIADDEFKLLAAFIKNNFGINLKEKKKTLLISRLNNLLSEMHVDNFMSFYERLKADEEGELTSQFIDRITTNYTYFMREAEHFHFFAQKLLPYFEEKITSKDLRIWCAASSTGEEPYTLAMLMEDYFKNSKDTWDKRLLATDLSSEALSKAKDGIYAKEKVRSLPGMWIMNYFETISANEYQIKKTMRDEVIYRRFNLLDPIFPFKKKFHAIFCRNVMIYFDNMTKDAVIEKLYDSLEYGGYLFLGHSESINRKNSKFQYIRPAVYRKVYWG